MRCGCCVTDKARWCWYEANQLLSSWSVDCIQSQVERSWSSFKRGQWCIWGFTDSGFRMPIVYCLYMCEQVPLVEAKGGHFKTQIITRRHWSKRIYLRHDTLISVHASQMCYLLVFGSRPSDHYFRSVCLSVCLFVCLFVQSFFQPSSTDLDQTRTHVTCPGLVVSPRI